MSTRQNIEQNKPTVFISVAGSLIVGICLQFFSNFRVDAKEIENKINEKPSKEYVDQRINEVQTLNKTAIEYLVETVGKIDRKMEGK